RHEEVLFIVHAGFGEDLAGSPGDETLAPELDTVAASRTFEAHAVDHRDVAAVGDRVTSLNQFPGALLVRSVFLLFLRVPADGGGIKQYLSPLQRRETRAFGIPLVPTDEHADLRVPGLPRFETEIARREIKLFIVQRVVGNVHLAIDAEQRTAGVDDRRRVVI